MEEFLNRLGEAAEAGDIKEFEDLSKSILYLSFWQSLEKELTETAYFPDLNPEFSDSFNSDKSKTELKKEAIERIQKDPALLAYTKCDWQGIKEITDYNFITLFETALLIGYRIDKDPCKLLSSCPALFLQAIISKEIDPREPTTLIPYSKLHKSPKAISGNIFFEKEHPDLSWKLTLKEAAEFAVLSGYPEPYFSDLLSDTPLTEAEAIDQVTAALSDVKPAYLDESHPMFSRELSIAIEAWQQVLSGNPPKQKTGSRKKLIIDWLEKHHKGHLRKEAIERIAVMLNPDGNGGAPPTD